MVRWRHGKALPPIWVCFPDKVADETLGIGGTDHATDQTQGLGPGFVPPMTGEEIVPDLVHLQGAVAAAADDLRRAVVLQEGPVNKAINSRAQPVSINACQVAPKYSFPFTTPFRPSTTSQQSIGRI